MRNIYKLFYLQSFISSAPTVLLVSLIPYLVEHVFSTNTSLAKVGFLFFIIRLSILFGSKITTYFLIKRTFHKVSSVLELIHSIALGLLFYSVLVKNLPLFYISIIIRFIGLGMLNNVRFTWLKHAEEIENKSRIYLFSKVFIQSSYIVAGATLLFVSKSSELLFVTIFIDMLTSIIGSILFLKLGVVVTKEFVPPVRKRFYFKKLSSSIKRLSLNDILFSFCMGGINTFIYKNGITYFNNYGGYGLVLVLYSLFYLIAGNIVGNLSGFKLINKLSMWGILASLILIILVKNEVLQIINFSLLFVSFATFNLSLEKIWFNIIDPSKSPMIFANRLILVSVVSAFCEYLYSIAPTHEIQIRIAFALVTAINFVFLLRDDSIKAAYLKS